MDYFSRRWRGAVPLDRLFWWDMLLFGSVINIVAGAVALLTFTGDLPAWVPALIFVLPLPYNFFLALAVSRQAEREAVRNAIAYKGAALIWLVVASLI